jgi:hypothetical protein
LDKVYRMKAKLVVLASTLPAVLFLAGCATPLPPGAERGPHNTMAYDVLVESSPPGARIEANGEDLGPAPVHLKIFGDPDGTFHDFGSYYYVVRALPEAGATNEHIQMRAFQTGHALTPEDRIPQKIYFDMTQPPPAYQTAAPGPGPYPPGYYGPYPYPYYYGYYGPYYGPRIYIGGPRYYHRW